MIFRISRHYYKCHPELLSTLWHKFGLISLANISSTSAGKPFKYKSWCHVRQSINCTTQQDCCFVAVAVKQWAGTSFYKHGLTLIPAWISNYTLYKMWYETTYPFDTLSMLGLKLNHVSKIGPWGHRLTITFIKNYAMWFCIHIITLAVV